ncbi:hypothetical protein, partial [Pseudomonas sp. C11]|uniref:hypothetical protein n=1 Tax=Pseudomonas sp. C11 TaxID=3075550 RepID=UPI002AFE24AE
TQLAQQVLGQLTLPMLGENILRFFASYLVSVVCAVYVRDEHGRLVRVACYGLSTEEQAREQIESDHHGLLAQAVREGRLLRLEELPED